MNSHKNNYQYKSLDKKTSIGDISQLIFIKTDLSTFFLKKTNLLKTKKPYFLIYFIFWITSGGESSQEAVSSSTAFRIE